MSPSLHFLQAALQRPAAPAPGTPIVLVADADAQRGRELAAKCTGFGWSPMLAVDALQAVTFANRGRPDLVVLHTRLPGGNGLGALERIRRLPQLGDVPAVVVGVPDEDAALIAALRAACPDVVLLRDAMPGIVATVLSGLLPVGAAPRRATVVPATAAGTHDTALPAVA